MGRVFCTHFSGQVTGKKNSKQIARTKAGRIFLRQSDRAKEQETEMVLQFLDDYAEQGFNVAQEPLREPVRITVEITNKDLRKHDLDNQLSTILDALVESTILSGDDQKCVPEITIIYKGLDRKSPLATIRLEELEGDDNGRN